MLLDEKYMRLALAEAKKGLGRTSPNPMVGAVIVKNGKVLAKGYHHYYGADHAEVDAFKKAGEVKGAKLYATLEPCNHTGLTPPCVDEVIRRGIKDVVIAMKDPNAFTNGKSIQKLKKAGIKVTVGVLESDARKLNEAFIKYMTTKLPFVVAKSAQTLDGKIASRTGHSQWMTESKTRNFTRRLRDSFDAILVGRGTALKDNPKLTGIRNKNLKKIVLDSTLQISKSAQLFKNTLNGQCIVATTLKASKVKIKILEKMGVQVIVCPVTANGIDLKWLFKELVKNGIISILIEGGARTIGLALKQNVVDKIQIFVAPKILGDQEAVSSITGLNIVNVNYSIQLKDITIQKIYNDLLIEGYVYRNR